MSLYKKILAKLEDFGFYQIRIFILVSLLEISTAISMVLPVLTHAKVNFRCSFFINSQNTTDSNSSNGNSSSDLLNLTKQDDLLLTFTTEQTNVSFCDNCCDQKCSEITFSPEFTSIISEWNLVCDQNSLTNSINTLTMVGLFCGGFVSGQLSDQFGRKRVLYGSFTLLLIFQLISGFSNSWQLYLVCRFFIGALMSSVMVSNFILPMEYVIPKWRTFIGCIGFWPVGIIVLSIWGYFVRNWRYLTLTTVCAGFPMLVTWWFVTESPRWLFTHGKKEAAEKILKDIEKHNKAPPTELLKIYQIIQDDEEEHALKTKNYSYWHLFGSFEMCKKTLIFYYGWFTCCSVYYGLLFTTKNLSGNPYINLFLSGVVELPAVFFVVAFNNRLGRKKTIIMLVGTTGISLFSMLFIHIGGVYDFYPNVILMLAMFAKFGIAGGWAALQVFSGESFPTVVRSLGVGSCSMIGRVGAIFAVQIISLDEISKHMPFVIFGVECLIFVGLLFCLPETAGRPLKDILESKRQKLSTDPLNVTEMEKMNQTQKGEEKEGSQQNIRRTASSDSEGTNKIDCSV